MQSHRQFVQLFGKAGRVPRSRTQISQNKSPTIYFDAHEHIYHLMLGQISSEEDAAGRGMLTALVVLKDSGMPGDGFWDLAKRLGRNVSDKIACWVQETEFVLSHCKNHPLVVQQP
jgi:hypothetical protein